jgi:hypothetical protein
MRQLGSGEHLHKEAVLLYGYVLPIDFFYKSARLGVGFNLKSGVVNLLT